MIGLVFLLGKRENIKAEITADEHTRLEIIQNELFANVDSLNENCRNIMPPINSEDYEFVCYVYYRENKGKSIFQEFNVSRGEELSVVGDVHGDACATKKYVCRAITEKKPTCFLGDFLDRGSNSVETALIFMVSNLLQPGMVFGVFGNHDNFMGNYGFLMECYLKGLNPNLLFLAICSSPVIMKVNFVGSSKSIIAAHGGPPSWMGMDDLGLQNFSEGLDAAKDEEEKRTFLRDADPELLGNPQKQQLMKIPLTELKTLVRNPATNLEDLTSQKVLEYPLGENPADSKNPVLQIIWRRFNSELSNGQRFTRVDRSGGHYSKLAALEFLKINKAELLIVGHSHDHVRADKCYTVVDLPENKKHCTTMGKPDIYEITGTDRKGNINAGGITVVDENIKLKAIASSSVATPAMARRLVKSFEVAKYKIVNESNQKSSIVASIVPADSSDFLSAQSRENVKKQLEKQLYTLRMRNQLGIPDNHEIVLEYLNEYTLKLTTHEIKQLQNHEIKIFIDEKLHSTVTLALNPNLISDNNYVFGKLQERYSDFQNFCLDETAFPTTATLSLKAEPTPTKEIIARIIDETEDNREKERSFELPLDSKISDLIAEVKKDQLLNDSFVLTTNNDLNHITMEGKAYNIVIKKQPDEAPVPSSASETITLDFKSKIEQLTSASQGRNSETCMKYLLANGGNLSLAFIALKKLDIGIPKYPNVAVLEDNTNAMMTELGIELTNHALRSDCRFALIHEDMDIQEAINLKNRNQRFNGTKINSVFNVMQRTGLEYRMCADALDLANQDERLATEILIIGRNATANSDCLINDEQYNDIKKMSKLKRKNLEFQTMNLDGILATDDDDHHMLIPYGIGTFQIITITNEQVIIKSKEKKDYLATLSKKFFQQYCCIKTTDSSPTPRMFPNQLLITKDTNLNELGEMGFNMSTRGLSGPEILNFNLFRNNNCAYGTFEITAYGEDGRETVIEIMNDSQIDFLELLKTERYMDEDNVVVLKRTSPSTAFAAVPAVAPAPAAPAKINLDELKVISRLPELDALALRFKCTTGGVLVDGLNPTIDSFYLEEGDVIALDGKLDEKSLKPVTRISITRISDGKGGTLIIRNFLSNMIKTIDEEVIDGVTYRRLSVAELDYYSENYGDDFPGKFFYNNKTYIPNDLRLS
jgi:hypothetical protein